MNWRFWEPAYTAEAVARQLVAGLRDGSIVLAEPLADEPLDADLDSEKVVFQLDLPAGTTNEGILELVKQCVRGADEQNRTHGGRGLELEAVRVESPKIKVALRPKAESEKVSAV